MKVLHMTTATILFAVGLFSCQRNIDAIPSGGTANSLITNSYPLKTFSMNGRTYTLHYDSNNVIDSIVAAGPGSTNYTYRVTHHGAYIDSSSLWQDGQLVSSRKDVVYDSLDRITSFTYQLYVYPTMPRYYALTYTSASDVHTLGDPGSAVRDTFAYSSNHGLISHKPEYSDPIPYYFLFTNDTYENPLSKIHGAAVIFTEESFYALWFNGRNVTQATEHFVTDRITNYVNTYDLSGRITSSVGTGNQSRTITFTYY